MKAIKDTQSISCKELADLILLHRIKRFRYGARRSLICNGYPPTRYQSCRDSLMRLERNKMVEDSKDGAKAMVEITTKGKQRLRLAPGWPKLVKERKVRAMAMAATRGESA